MPLCDYGCGQEAIHQFKNGRWCCSNNIAKCSKYREINSIKLSGKEKSTEHKNKISLSRKNKIPWNKGLKINLEPWNKGLTKESDERIALYGKKQSETKKDCNYRIPSKYKGKTYEEIYGEREAKRLKKIHTNLMLGNNGNKRTIKYIQRKYSTFYKEEEMRYNPDKLGEKEIQVHCKNHNCPNSKEQGGWFTPTTSQLNDRIRALESKNGTDGSYFYCSINCKNSCPLYRLQNDPFKDIDKSYTQSEYQQFRQYVLERDNYICQYCGKKAEHVHHERPQKLEPFFSLDPDFAWSVCKKCHYEKGHTDKCSTGIIAIKLCQKGNIII